MVALRSGVVVKGLLAAGFALLAFFMNDADAAGITATFLVLALLSAGFAWREGRNPPVPGPHASPTDKPPGLRTAFIVCGALLVIDALFIGAPMLGAYAGLALVLWLVPRMLFAWKKPLPRRHRARVALVTLGMILIDCGIYSIYES